MYVYVHRLARSLRLLSLPRYADAVRDDAAVVNLTRSHLRRSTVALGTHFQVAPCHVSCHDAECRTSRARSCQTMRIRNIPDGYFNYDALDSSMNWKSYVFFFAKIADIIRLNFNCGLLCEREESSRNRFCKGRNLFFILYFVFVTNF